LDRRAANQPRPSDPERAVAKSVTFAVEDAGRDDILSRLSVHRALGGAPREELEWLAEHGTPHAYPVGGVTTRKGQPEEWLQVVLSGHLVIHVDRGAGSRKIIEWRDGDVCGLMPYSRGGAPPGDTVAEAPTDTLAVHRDLLPTMIRECPRVTALLVHAMLDRARHFTSSDLHDEKLVSLGKLAAGLAHELSNPASAGIRAAKLLAASLGETDAATRMLEGARLSDAQRATLDEVRAVCASAPVSPSRSPIDRADREDAIVEWLDSHRVDDAIAATLADADITLATLDTLAGSISGPVLDAALRSIAGDAVVRRLASEIEASLTRINELVGAVKRFTFMDRAPTAESTDIRPGIADTIAVLGAKIRNKSVAVELRLAPDLPRVLAFGGELNQVWLNLIDNALDAVAPSGRIEISAAAHRLGRVEVCIVDDGPGIPREDQGRIFDPFFTTKGVGQGTGLGLDIVRRLVQRHHGEIDVTSRPGHTAFCVRLPVATS
jgi:signal transduction histidine kinase